MNASLIQDPGWGWPRCRPEKRAGRVKFLGCIGCLLGMLPGVSLQAGLFVDIGTVFLQPGQSGQPLVFALQNTGEEAIGVAGLSWNVQVADSGPPAAGGFGSVPGPRIEWLDLLTGTLFEGNHTGPVNAGSIAQFANWTVTTQADVVVIGAGETVVLGTAYFDATGFVGEAEWSLHFDATINGPTQFFNALGEPMPLRMVDGKLAVVPEPPLAAGFASALLLAWSGWRRWRNVHTGHGVGTLGEAVGGCRFVVDRSKDRELP